MIDKASPARRTRAGVPEHADRREAPLRVVWSIDSMGSGGTELNAVRTAEHLDREKVDLTVVCLSGPGPMSERYADAGVPVVHLPLSSLYHPSTLKQGLRLARLLRRRRAEILHAHDIYSNIFAVPWARLAGVRGVIASRRWWVSSGGELHRIANRMASRVAHRTLVNARQLMTLVGDAERISPERMAWIPNFLEEEAFKEYPRTELREFRRARGIPENELVVGVVANLRPVKDHPTLIKAVRRLVEEDCAVHLVIVGDGPERPRLEEFTVSAGLEDHVHFTGHQPNRPNPHGLFDVSVLSSVSEGFPNTLLEAMAAGNPVVATDVGGNPDIVDDGTTGFLVPPGDPGALARTIAALSRDEALRLQLGSTGRKVARERYRAASVLPRLEGLYEELARPKVTGGAAE